MSDVRDHDAVAGALRRHPFLDGLAAADVDELARCGAVRTLEPGHRLATEGEPAQRFHLITEGRVGIEVHLPRSGALVVATVEPGEVVGWSWMFPPHHWTFDATAMTEIVEVALDVEPLRRVLARRPALDAEITRRLGAVLASRLRSARTQLLDLYGTPS